MVASALTLYLVIHAEEQVYSVDVNQIVARINHPQKLYIGLRESRDEAISRVEQIHTRDFQLPMFVLLKISFTSLGVAHYTTNLADVDHCFAPILHKQTYNDKTQDWGVWHFHGNMPLRQESDAGDLLISTEWSALA